MICYDSLTHNILNIYIMNRSSASFCMDLYDFADAKIFIPMLYIIYMSIILFDRSFIKVTYDLNSSQIYHYDLYRIKNLKELEELDFFENLNNNITFIEWPEMLISLPLNKKYYLINLDIISETKRKINISFNQ